jgi:hypothetical protein
MTDFDNETEVADAMSEQMTAEENPDETHEDLVALKIKRSDC